MTSMHRRWSARVHMPTYGPSNSVAECMNWSTNQRRAEDIRVAFQDEPEIISTTRYNGDMYARPVTPYSLQKRSNTPIPSTEKAWTFSTEADNPPICNTPGHIIHVPAPPLPVHTQDVYTGRHYNTIDSSRRTPSRLYGKYDHADSFNPYTDSRDVYDTQNHIRYNPDKEEMIRDQLVRQQIESYERQIDYEKSQLSDDLQNHYSDHVRRAMTPSYLNQREVTDAVREVSRRNPTKVYFDDPNRRYASKPPIPRPPKSNLMYPKTAYPRHVDSRGAGHIHGCRPNSAYASRQHYTDFQREPVGTLSSALTTKRVNFQTPRPGSASSMRDLRKSGHFSQWRDNTTHQLPHPPARNDQPWKMSRFTRSAQPRIDNRWDRDPYVDSIYSGSDNKVKVNVECEEGNNMDLNLSVSRTNDNAFVVL